MNKDNLNKPLVEDNIVAQNTLADQDSSSTDPFDPTREARDGLIKQLKSLLSFSAKGRLTNKQLHKFLDATYRLNSIQEMMIRALVEVLKNLAAVSSQESMKLYNLNTFISATTSLLFEKEVLEQEELNERHRKFFISFAPESFQEQYAEEFTTTSCNVEDIQNEPSLPIESIEDSEDLLDNE